MIGGSLRSSNHCYFTSCSLLELIPTLENHHTRHYVKAESGEACAALTINITCGLIVPPRGQTSEPTPLSPPTPLPPPTPQWADFRAYPPRPRASRVSTLYEHPLRPSVWAPSALWAHLPSLRAPSTLWAPPSPCPSAHTAYGYRTTLFPLPLQWQRLSPVWQTPDHRVGVV